MPQASRSESNTGCSGPTLSDIYTHTIDRGHTRYAKCEESIMRPVLGTRHLLGVGTRPYLYLRTQTQRSTHRQTRTTPTRARTHTNTHTHTNINRKATNKVRVATHRFWSCSAALNGPRSHLHLPRSVEGLQPQQRVYRPAHIGCDTKANAVFESSYTYSSHAAKHAMK